MHLFSEIIIHISRWTNLDCSSLQDKAKLQTWKNRLFFLKSTFPGKCIEDWAQCSVLHLASLSTRCILRTMKVVSNFSKSFTPGVHDSAAALGIIKALVWNIWHRSTSCRILQDMHPGVCSGNVCQFNTAGSNGSSILLPKWPAFTLKLISCMSFSWFLSEISWQ